MASGSEVDEMIVGSDDNSDLHVLNSDIYSVALHWRSHCFRNHSLLSFVCSFVYFI